MRCAGDFGSFVSLAWKRSEAVDVFGPLPINPYSKARLRSEYLIQAKTDPKKRAVWIESDLGLRSEKKLRRFVAPKAVSR
jgi:hypothetical protein